MKIKFIKLKINEVIFIAIIFAMIFYAFGIKFTPLFQYVDDVFVIIFIGYAVLKSILNKKKKKILDKNDKIIIGLIALLIVIGLVGNLLSNYQSDLKSILSDILSFFKFFGIYVAGLIVFYEKNGDRYFEIAKQTSKVILTIMLGIVILNQIFDWGLGEKYQRYGLPIYSLGGAPIICRSC